MWESGETGEKRKGEQQIDIEFTSRMKEKGEVF